MAVFDDTTLSLILAGDKPAAVIRLDAGHHLELLETMGATTERAVNQQRATSGDSHTVGPGPFVFTINEGNLGWKANDFVVITDATDPLNNYMLCRLSADQDPSGDINVNVEYQVGSGLSSSWTIVLTVFILAATVPPPFAVAQGGTGATTLQGVRDNFEVTRVFEVESIESSPPGGESVGDKFLVGDAPSGLFATHENEIALWSGSYSFETPLEKDQAYDKATQEQYLYVDSALFTGGLWGDSKWRSLTPRTTRTLDFVGTPTRTILPEELELGKVWRCDPVSAGAPITLTIPDPAAAGVLGSEILVAQSTVGTVTVNVTGGATINGSATIQTTTQYAYRRLLAAESGGGGQWYVVGSGD